MKAARRRADHDSQRIASEYQAIDGVMRSCFQAPKAVRFAASLQSSSRAARRVRPVRAAADDRPLRSNPEFQTRAAIPNN